MSFQDKLRDKQNEQNNRQGNREKQLDYLTQLIQPAIEKEAKERYDDFTNQFASFINRSGNRRMDRIYLPSHMDLVPLIDGLYEEDYRTLDLLTPRRTLDWDISMIILPFYGNINGVLKLTKYYYDYMRVFRDLAKVDNIMISDPVCSVLQRVFNGQTYGESIKEYTYEQIKIPSGIKLREKSRFFRWNIHYDVSLYFNAEYHETKQRL